MKKSIVLCATLCAALVMTGCKSKESAYRKAYDKAKAAEAEAAQNYNNTETDCYNNAEAYGYNSTGADGYNDTGTFTCF